MCNTMSGFQSLISGASKDGATKKSGLGAMAGLMSGAAAATATASSFKDPKKPEAYYDDPPDSTELGKGTWTLLHSIAATYPEKPTSAEQNQMHTFLQIFGNIYPCWYCASDFRKWISKPENDPKPQLETQDKFGRWLCAAHNAVNKKINKPEFDCNLWKARWIDGWDEIEAEAQRRKEKK